MKENKAGCDLRSCYLCRRCLKEWVPAISANRKTFLVKKGESIFFEGDEVKGIYFVYEGTFKVHKKWDEEKELIVRFARKGDILGHRGLGSDPLYPVTATALESASVCYIHLDFFQSSLKMNYDFIYGLMMFFATELKESEKNMRNLAHMPVKGRVAAALVQLQEKFSINEEGAINIPLSRQDLASVAGTTYETVFRVLNEMVADQLVSVAAKGIIIRDMDKLRSAIRK